MFRTVVGGHSERMDADPVCLVHSSNLTFSLAAGWSFVETEDWRPDLDGAWADGVGGDDGESLYCARAKDLCSDDF